MKIPQSHQFRHILISGALIFFIVLIAFCFQNQFAPMIAQGQQGSAPKSLSGFAWSSNIGWIGFKGWSNSVKLSSDNKFINYAWSSNIGWIKFDPSTIFATGDGWPVGAVEEYKHGAQLESDGTTVTGWARACSVFQSGCSHGLKPDTARGGWDGWISLNCLNTNSCATSYGITYDSDTGQLTNFAWGADVVGWISFCPKVDLPADISGACVTVDSLRVSCTANGLTNPTITAGAAVIWEAQVTAGGVSPYNYTYCWGTNCGDPSVLGDVNYSDSDAVSVPGGYSTGPVEANVKVTDNTSLKTGVGACSIQINNPANPVLRVSVDGGDYGEVIASKTGNGQMPDPPGNWTTEGCRTTDCSSTYLSTDSVNLTAIADTVASGGTCEDPPGTPNSCEFDGWTGDCSSFGSSPVCTLTMGNENKFAGAKFKNPGITEEEVTLNAFPAKLEINSHNEGSLAKTVRATITATSAGNLDNAELCVESFNALISGQSINTIVSNPDDKLECVLNGQDGDNLQNCVEERQCVSFRNNSGIYTAGFQVRVPTKLTLIPKNYLIKLVVQGANLKGEVTIPFSYKPGGGGP